MDLTYDLGLSEVVICRQPAGRGVGDDGPWLKSQGPATERLSARRRATTLPAERRTAESNDEISGSSAASIDIVFTVTDGRLVWIRMLVVCRFVFCVSKVLHMVVLVWSAGGARAMAVGLSRATVKGRIIVVEK